MGNVGVRGVSVLLAVSKVYSDKKVRIPWQVRGILGVKPGDYVAWILEEDGSVRIVKYDRLKELTGKPR